MPVRCRDRGLGALEGLRSLRADLLFEAAQATVALAQLLGDVIDATAVGRQIPVLSFEAADQPGHRLVHTLDGDGGAALGGLESGGDGLDRGGHALQGIVLARISVVHPARPAPALVQVGGVRTARQGHHALVLILVEDHGVEPLAESQAGAPRQILGDLARLGVYSLHAPRRGCAH
jgi:hypothetical protein